jgi:hypothetical protein
MENSTGATRTNRPVDGLALWEEGGEGPGADLAVIRLDQNERLLVPFTTTLLPMVLHYLDYPSLQGYVQCNGPGCLLCRVGRQQEKRDVWPIYDLVEKAVGVLLISPNQRPHSLRRLLLPVFRRLAGGEGPLLLSLRKDGSKFSGSTLPLPEAADHGAAAIRTFLEQVEAGQVDLGSPLQKLADEDLAMIEEIKAHMVAKGITLG